MSRFFTRAQRRVLSLLAAGRCQSCGDPLPADFHADHRRPHTLGGPTILINGQALCPPCNLSKGSTMPTKLRNWQQTAHDQGVSFLADNGNRNFFINAAPGSGKTRVSCAIAQTLMQRGVVDRVVVIAPRAEVVKQWATEFERVTGQPMTTITGKNETFHKFGHHVCATWSAIAGAAEAFQILCRKTSVLVICDEQHHAAVKAAWGQSADAAFKEAKHAVILTGTPIRSDGAATIWLPHGEEGGISQPAAGVYTLTYGQAVDAGYCRPITFHRHEGLFRVRLQGDVSLQVSSGEEADLPADHPAADDLRRSLTFYQLVCEPQRDRQGQPCLDSYQASMIEWAGAKLDALRDRMDNAGGLVIAPNIQMAKFFAELIERIEGEAPMLVHSEAANAENSIKLFRRSDTRWLVSVAMVSEGVDIPRLRVLIYLPSALTELSFRQAVGRVVRSSGLDDDTRAYVVMPSIKLLDIYARRVEEEMPAIAAAGELPSTRKCPKCRSECAHDATECEECGHAFEPRRAATVPCPACNILNPVGREKCLNCGEPFVHKHEFEVTLQEAQRDGAITRGVDVSETEVRFAEEHGAAFRDQVHRSGDAHLIRLMQSMPEECLGRLCNIAMAMRRDEESTAETTTAP